MTDVKNWVEQETTTAGTGPVTVAGSIAGSATWLAAFGSGVSAVYYSIQSGNNRETGEGSYDGSTQVLTRTTVRSTLVGGVYDDTSPAPISLAGTSTVRCTFNTAAFDSMPTMFVQPTDPGAAAKLGDFWIPYTP